jgi:putative cardiolipin synthase
MFKFDAIIILAALSALLLMGGCATLPDNFERPASHAYTDTDDTRLGKARHDKQLAHPGQSGFLLLANGLDAFVARAVLANRAERSIDVQYFMLHGDLIGRLFIEQLLIAADRGVRVRLLVDDIALGGRDLDAAMLDSHPNIEVRIFNPFSRKTSRISQFVTRLGSVTRRMHNKSFTVDNQAAILGGRNIGNEYFEADPEVAFGDLDVLVIGPVVRDVSDSFDLYWNSEWAYPALVLKGKPPTPEETRLARQELSEFVVQQADSAYLQALGESDLANEIRRGEVSYSWGKAEVIYDQPEKIVHDFSKRELHLASKLSPYLEETREEMIIFTPYFVPGKKGTASLIQLSERGVRVRILTNSLASTNHSIVHSGYAKYRKRLLRAGVELYEMNKKYSDKDRKDEKGEHGSSEAVLHAKSFVLDREKVFIGSLNLDPRAIYHNTEIGVVLKSSEIANEMGDWFDQNIEQVAFRLELHTNENGSEKILWHGMENGEERIYSVEPHTGFCLRFGIGCISFLPIESQL